MKVIKVEEIVKRIYSIRGKQVMFDHDLAQMYEVETKQLNQAVKRNIERFPERFRFQLLREEYENLLSQFPNSQNMQDIKSQTAVSNKDSLRSQNVTLKNRRGRHRKYLPYVFTEQGVSMLSAVLRSKTAVKVSIQIIDAFVEMRRFLVNNANLFQRIENVETKLLTYQIKTDEKIDLLFEAIEEKNITQVQGVLFEGQIFDAYKLAADIIRKAKKSIILIDNYVDDTVLNLFTKRKKNVKVTIYTKRLSKTLQQDLEKFNSQYEQVEIKKLKFSHDRFLILDDKTIYHFGASLKDLGKKWFAFSKLDLDANIIIDKL